MNKRKTKIVALAATLVLTDLVLGSGCDKMTGIVVPTSVHAPARVQAAGR